jgi:hypothetical protein
LCVDQAYPFNEKYKNNMLEGREEETSLFMRFA